MSWKSLSSRARPLVQTSFVLLTLAVGLRFWLYVRGLLAGAAGPAKPGGVEGFLPVAALVGLKHWLASGQFDPVHPAGLAILLSVTLVSLLFAKGFCGWLCPVGAGCDGLRRAGRALGLRARLPRWLDLPLRGVKYLLLAALLYGTQVGLDAAGAAAFLASPYNLTADVQMLRLLLAPGAVFLAVVGLCAAANLAGVSLWCRHLCPYGALLGLAGLLGPGRLRRDESLCVHCDRCRAACPSALPLPDRGTVKSPECCFCGRCVEACPAPGALRLEVFARPLPPWAVGALCAGLLAALTAAARLTGHWDSTVPREAVSAALRQVGGALP